jgi:DNA-binding protein WhiA
MKTFLNEIKTEIQQTPHLKSGAGAAGSDTARAHPDLVRTLRGLLPGSAGGFSRGYHLEFPFDDLGEARALCDALAVQDIFANISPGGTGGRPWRVYIKDSESICNLLALVGANKSLYKLNNLLALRSVRNTSNRRANCDTANISRQIETAAPQIEAISRLAGREDFRKLPKYLQATARARLDNPDATYDELAGILGISKSGTVHRLRTLMQYDKL